MIYGLVVLTILLALAIRCLYVEQQESDHKDTVIAVYRIRNKKQAAEIEYEKQRNRDLAREINRLKQRLRVGDLAKDAIVDAAERKRVDL